MDGGLDDITAEDQVQLEIRHDGTVMWITIGGQTVVRICRMKDLVILDERPTI